MELIAYISFSDIISVLALGVAATSLFRSFGAERLYKAVSSAEKRTHIHIALNRTLLESEDLITEIQRAFSRGGLDSKTVNVLEHADNQLTDSVEELKARIDNLMNNSIDDPVLLEKYRSFATVTEDKLTNLARDIREIMDIEVVD